MIISGILIIINLFIVFILIPFLVVYIGNYKKEVFLYGACGILVYIVGERLCANTISSILATSIPDSPIWTNMTLYWIYLGIISAVFVGIATVFSMYMLNKLLKRNPKRIEAISLGVGIGWGYSLFGWGFFNFYLLKKIFCHEEVYAFDIATSAIVYGVLERILEIIFFIGLAYICQLFILRKQIYIGLLFLLLIQSACRIIFYFLSYMINIPRILVIVIYGGVIFAVLKVASVAQKSI